MARKNLKRLTQSEISYGGKAIIHLEDSYVMFLGNHILTMDAHHGIFFWVKIWKIIVSCLKHVYSFNECVQFYFDMGSPITVI